MNWGIFDPQPVSDLTLCLLLGAFTLGVGAMVMRVFWRKKEYLDAVRMIVLSWVSALNALAVYALVPRIVYRQHGRTWVESLTSGQQLMYTCYGLQLVLMVLWVLVTIRMFRLKLTVLGWFSLATVAIEWLGCEVYNDYNATLLAQMANPGIPLTVRLNVWQLWVPLGVAITCVVQGVLIAFTDTATNVLIKRLRARLGIEPPPMTMLLPVMPNARHNGYVPAGPLNQRKYGVPRFGPSRRRRWLNKLLLVLQPWAYLFPCYVPTYQREDFD